LTVVVRSTSLTGHAGRRAHVRVGSFVALTDRTLLISTADAIHILAAR